MDVAFVSAGQAPFTLKSMVLHPVDWGAIAPHLSKDLIRKLTLPDSSFHCCPVN